MKPNIWTEKAAVSTVGITLLFISFIEYISGDVHLINLSGQLKEGCWWSSEQACAFGSEKFGLHVL